MGISGATSLDFASICLLEIVWKISDAKFPSFQIEIWLYFDVFEVHGEHNEFPRRICHTNCYKTDARLATNSRTNLVHQRTGEQFHIFPLQSKQFVNKQKFKNEIVKLIDRKMLIDDFIATRTHHSFATIDGNAFWSTWRKMRLVITTSFTGVVGITKSSTRKAKRFFSFLTSNLLIMICSLLQRNMSTWNCSIKKTRKQTRIIYSQNKVEENIVSCRNGKMLQWFTLRQRQLKMNGTMFSVASFCRFSCFTHCRNTLKTTNENVQKNRKRGKKLTTQNGTR